MSPPAREDGPADASLAVEVVLRLGAVMLGAGSPTDDVERAMRSAAGALGLTRTTAVVSFGTIWLSYFPGAGTQPVTAMQLVPERVTDYRRLSAAAHLVRDLRAGQSDLSGAVNEIERIASLDTAWPEPFTSLAQAGSAAASTLLFGGSALDALATLVIGAFVQPIVVRLDRSGLPPFFRSLIGPLVSSILVAVAVALGTPIDAALVLTGSLLRFLPGAALVAGMRDLIDQSIISGSARMAEAFFLGAAVAVGTAIGIGIASEFGVSLEVGASIGTGQPAIQVLAAALACGFWAVRLGEPRSALLTASLLGALGWAVFLLTSPLGAGGVVATALAGIAVGAIGRLLARRADAPVVLMGRPGVAAAAARAAHRERDAGAECERRPDPALDRGRHGPGARCGRGVRRHPGSDRAAGPHRDHRAGDHPARHPGRADRHRGGDQVTAGAPRRDTGRAGR